MASAVMRGCFGGDEGGRAGGGDVAGGVVGAAGEGGEVFVGVEEVALAGGHGAEGDGEQGEAGGEGDQDEREEPRGERCQAGEGAGRGEEEGTYRQQDAAGGVAGDLRLSGEAGDACRIGRGG